MGNEQKPIQLNMERLSNLVWYPVKKTEPKQGGIMMNSKTQRITILGLMTAVMIVFAFTPIGSIPIGPLVISLQVIPVAICAVVFGPWGGAIAGLIFGILSTLQAFGIGIPSGMGMALVAINPFLAVVQRIIPRVLCGLCAGLIFKVIRKKNLTLACFVAGLATAFFNTLFFMSALVILFGNTSYMQELIAGRNIIVFICAFVGINAVVEMVSASIVTGAIGTALYKSRFIQ